MGGEAIDPLMEEMREVNARVRQLEIDIAVAKRTPAMVTQLIDEAGTAVKARLGGLSNALMQDSEGAREVYRELFPAGLTFRPAESAPRRWAIEGTAEIKNFSLRCDPNGI